MTVFPGLKVNEGTAITFGNGSNHKHGPKWPKEKREISESTGNQGLISFSLKQPSGLLAVGGIGSINPSKDRSVPQPLEPVNVNVFMEGEISVYITKINICIH